MLYAIIPASLAIAWTIARTLSKFPSVTRRIPRQGSIAYFSLAFGLAIIFYFLFQLGVFVFGH